MEEAKPPPPNSLSGYQASTHTQRREGRCLPTRTPKLLNRDTPTTDVHTALCPQVYPTILAVSPTSGGPRGGQTVTLDGKGYDIHNPDIKVVLEWRTLSVQVIPAVKTPVKVVFVSPEFDMANFGAKAEIPMTIRLLFGAPGASNFKEAACDVAAGCTFTYLKQAKRPKTCNLWQFSDPNDVFAARDPHTPTLLYVMGTGVWAWESCTIAESVARGSA